MKADYKNKQEMISRLGRRIRQLRENKGFTVENIATVLDIPTAEWRIYEEGKDLDLITIIHICKMLDVSLKEFFGEGF